MSSKMKALVTRWATCKENKYDRHPNKPHMKPTPFPNYPGQTLHIDIFSTEKQLVLTAVNKFTKFAQTKIISSRSIEDIRRPLRDILFFFCVPEVVVIYN